MAYKPAPLIATSSREWTSDRIGALQKAEVRQLLANARRLGAEDTAALCERALTKRSGTVARRASTGDRHVPKIRNLLSLRKALELRAVYAESGHLSWSGSRKSDGGVVFMLWADSVQSDQFEHRYLLWAANKDDARPWSDEAAGRDRLKHCQLAILQGKAEGLLVYGVALEGVLPEQRAATIYGVDPQTILELSIERRGDEYWALWGSATDASRSFGSSK